MKVAELEGAELDYWVAKAEGKCNMEIHPDDTTKELICWEMNPPDTTAHGRGYKIFERSFRPSTEWFDGGPIIEREKIEIYITNHQELGEEWGANKMGRDKNKRGMWFEFISFGPIPLIAAMRAYVSSVYGGEVND